MTISSKQLLSEIPLHYMHDTVIACVPPSLANQAHCIAKYVCETHKFDHEKMLDFFSRSPICRNLKFTPLEKEGCDHLMLTPAKRLLLYIDGYFRFIFESYNLSSSEKRAYRDVRDELMNGIEGLDLIERSIDRSFDCFGYAFDHDPWWKNVNGNIVDIYTYSSSRTPTENSRACYIPDNDDDLAHYAKVVMEGGTLILYSKWGTRGRIWRHLKELVPAVYGWNVMYVTRTTSAASAAQSTPHK